MTETTGRPHATPRLRLPTPPWPLVVLVTGVALLFDVVRVFLPSLITLYGRAGETAPASMGMYAALWFVLPFAAVPAARLASPRAVLVTGAAALVAARLGLQAADGGTPQLLLASAGVTAGLVFLYGYARTTPGTWVPAGLIGGLAGSSIVHLALDRVDLVWRYGPLPWLAVIALCAVFLWAVFLWAVFPRAVRLTPASSGPAPAAVWFAFGPMLMLAGMYCGGASLLPPDTGPHTAPFIAVMTTLQAVTWCAAVVYAWTTSWSWVAGAFLVAGVAGVETGVPGLAALVTTVALGACAGAAGQRAAVPRAGVTPLAGAAAGRTAGAGSTTTDSDPPGDTGADGTATAAESTGRRGGVAVLGGMLVFLVATFLYYAAFDADLGFPHALVPVAVAALIAAVAARRGRRHRSAPVRRAPRRWGWIALSSALLTGLVTWQPLPGERPIGGNEFTLVTYNIRMGFGLGGRLDLDHIAAWAATRHPDVVLLSEVDRGWLLNGGHDDLARIARGLGMRYYFAPAADRLWGEAVLTNLPVHGGAGSKKLGRHGYPTGAQAQFTVLEVGDHLVTIVNTHLQEPRGQAPEVAALVRPLTGKGVAKPHPVIVAGDLNRRRPTPRCGCWRPRACPTRCGRSATRRPRPPRPPCGASTTS
ncbi:endonuclease/exonuclease/phosphatase family protein [Microbispora sp. CA-135349]|uniref:endonuclease/exonuclease/phosphatase family protein n=1 Tax=Microbispora sp. CA-135349 TaxID=3239953 RepID=UPI003D8A244D